MKFPISAGNMASTVSYLPPEMVEIIIDHCYDDFSSLLTFGLVARNWLGPSRYHAFHLDSPRIRISHEAKAEAFIVLLDSPYSTFPKFLHVLWLAGEIPYSLKNPVAFIDAIVARLQVRSLIILGSISSAMSIFPLLRGHFSTVVYLKLKLNGYSMSLNDALAFICSFPMLETLILTGSYTAPTATVGESLQPISLPPKLQSLCISMSYGTDEILHRLFDRPDPESSKYTCATLRHLTCTVNSATCGMWSVLQENMQLIHFSATLDLTGLEEIRSISLSAPYTHPIRWICDVLATSTSTHLEEINIVLHTYTPTELDPWKAFDQFLVSPKFAHLKRVTIRTASHHAVDVEKGFSGCKSRGILCMKTWPLCW